MRDQRPEWQTLAAFMYVRGLVEQDAAHHQIMDRAQLVYLCLRKLQADLEEVTDESPEEEIQSIFYEAGKLHLATELRFWFRVLYQAFLKQDDGPRLGQLTRIMTAYWIQQKIESTLTDPWGQP